MAVPYHTHDFEIPIATKDDVVAGVSNSKALTPASVGNAAARNVEDFATAEQGEKASTAVQPDDLAHVATSGDYNDLNNRPALGSVASRDITEVATAAQGALADTAVQPHDVGSAAFHNAEEFALADQVLPNGGSAGQVLAKKSGTDKDVQWITVDAAAAVSYAPQTLTEEEKGQAIANIGALNLSGYRNKIINGEFQINTNSPVNYGPVPPRNKLYVADRWFCENNTDNEIFAKTSYNGIQGRDPFFYITTNEAVTDGDFLLCQRIEQVVTLAGSEATITFSIKSANSLTVEAYLLQDHDGKGTDANRIEFGTHTIAGSRLSQRVSVAAHVPANPLIDNLNNSLKFVLRIVFSDIPRNSVEIRNVSLVAGDATAELDPSEPRHIQQEYALCRRYFRRYASRQNIADLKYFMRVTPTERNDTYGFTYDAEYAP